MKVKKMFLIFRNWFVCLTIILFPGSSQSLGPSDPPTEDPGKEAGPGDTCALPGDAGGGWSRHQSGV